MTLTLLTFLFPWYSDHLFRDQPLFAQTLVSVPDIYPLPKFAAWIIPWLLISMLLLPGMPCLKFSLSWWTYSSKSNLDCVPPLCSFPWSSQSESHLHLCASQALLLFTRLPHIKMQMFKSPFPNRLWYHWDLDNYWIMFISPGNYDGAYTCYLMTVWITVS